MFEVNEKSQKAVKVDSENSFDILIQELVELQAAVKTAQAQLGLSRNRMPKISENKKDMDAPNDKASVAAHNYGDGVQQSKQESSDESNVTNNGDENSKSNREMLDSIEKTVNEARNIFGSFFMSS